MIDYTMKGWEYPDHGKFYETPNGFFNKHIAGSRGWGGRKQCQTVPMVTVSANPGRGPWRV